jgi:hypothetical protein
MILMRRFATAAMVLATIPNGLTAQLPDGWEVRPDRPDSDLSELAFTEMPPGWHVTTGPAVILYRPEMEAGGAYRVEMEVFLFDPGSRRESFGFFIGGRQLDGEGQRYTYFLIREGRQFLVKARDGRETPTLVEWTDHDAVRAFVDREEGESSVRNVLAAEIGAEDVRFFVNGSEVTRIARDGLAVEGVVGLRVNHGLNLHVSHLELSPGRGEGS